MAEKEEETTSSNGEVEVEVDAWGTLEELLLVCAVNRHGTKSWDSISNELLKRRRIIHHKFEGDYFSPHNCRRKYVDLKRRFKEKESEEHVEEEEEEDELLRMVEELRKLRVEELKRQVQNHDVSIVSLQMKVKRLEEEREQEPVTKKPELSDLRIKPAEKTGGIPVEPAEKHLPGHSAEDQSFNESNSTKADRNATKKHEPDQEKGEPDPVCKLKAEPVSRTSRLGELGESLSESKRQQQSSDVQSSASLSKKKRRRFRGGGSSGDEFEAEEVSPANKKINVKSQPLIRFHDIVRSHKHGSVFQRRLPSQETEKYRNVIRQHMDLDTVQSKLDRGIYSECHPKFYRDLLLIFTNAVLFYRKSSAEHIAARELRKLVMDEITLRTRTPETRPVKTDPEPQHLEPVVKKPRSATTMVVCRRRPSSSSMQALSESMKNKEDSNHVIGANVKKNVTSSKVENGVEEKPKDDHHQKKEVDVGSNKSNAFGSREDREGDKGLGGVANSKKLLTRERSSLGHGALRLSNSNSKKIMSKEGVKREKSANNSNSNNNNNNNNSKEESSEGEGIETVLKKKINADQKQEKGTTMVLKKQGVANFLKRMKQNSPSSQEKAKKNESEEEKEDDDDRGGRIVRKKLDSTNNGKKTGGNSKRNSSSNNNNNNKDTVVDVIRRTSGRRGEKEAAASRRAIGRPPKRKAAMVSGNTPDSARGGRSGGRDSGEKSKKKPRR